MDGNNYFSLNGVSTNADLAYKIDIDNCQIVSNNYLTYNFILNSSYGITGEDSNGNKYIASVNSYTDGTDGN